MRGSLIAFEGLDQSGKQTQAEALTAALTGAGRSCELLSFPDYPTAIGGEIHRALHGERDYAADVMQLLYVANRYETRKPDRQLAGRGTRRSSATATRRRASRTARRRGSMRDGSRTSSAFCRPPT